MAHCGKCAGRSLRTMYAGYESVCTNLRTVACKEIFIAMVIGDYWDADPGVCLQSAFALIRTLLFCFFPDATISSPHSQIGTFATGSDIGHFVDCFTYLQIEGKLQLAKMMDEVSLKCKKWRDREAIDPLLVNVPLPWDRSLN